MRAAAVASGAAAFRALFLTHLHSDHITDLNDLITTRWVMSLAPNPWACVRARGHVRRGGCHRGDAGAGHRIPPGAPRRHWRPSSVVTEVDRGVIFEEGEVRVTSAPTDHAPVRPTVGFRIDEGERSVVIAGDTAPCAGLDGLCAGADVLVQTVVRRDLIEQLGLARLTDVLDYHSSVPDAAQTAARNGVHSLVLTHLVPPPAVGNEQEWLEQASDHFNGEVVLGADLLTLDVTVG